MQSLLAVAALGVEVALHHVVFAINLGQPALRLDVDQAIHPVGHVHTHRGHRAMIYIQAGIEDAEREAGAMAGSGERRRRAAAGSGHRVEVDIMRHLARRVIHQFEIDDIPLADADEFPRDDSSECPEGVIHAIGHLHDLFNDLEFDDDLGRMVPLDRRRHLWRIGQHGDFLPADISRHLNLLSRFHEFLSHGTSGSEQHQSACFDISFHEFS